METVGRKFNGRKGDVVAHCSYCGARFYASQLRKDRSGNWACPDDIVGRDAATLDAENAASATAFANRRKKKGSEAPYFGGIVYVPDEYIWNGENLTEGDMIFSYNSSGQRNLSLYNFFGEEDFPGFLAGEGLNSLVTIQLTQENGAYLRGPLNPENNNITFSGVIKKPTLPSYVGVGVINYRFTDYLFDVSFGYHMYSGGDPYTSVIAVYDGYYDISSTASVVAFVASLDMYGNFEATISCDFGETQEISGNTGTDTTVVYKNIYMGIFPEESGDDYGQICDVRYSPMYLDQENRIKKMDELMRRWRTV